MNSIKTEKESKFVSAVFYVRNCENKIFHFLNKVNDTFKDNFHKFELICVNDSSMDGSVEEIKKFASEQKNINISIINMSYHQGREACMNAGIDLAIGDYVFEFDKVLVDFQADIIMGVYYELFKGYDIVNAVPGKNGRLSSKLFYRIFNKYANMQYELETEVFRVLSRRAINRVHTMSKTIPYRKAIYANCGLKQRSIKIEVEDMGISSETEIEKKELALNSLILFTNAAYRFATIITIIMMLATVFFGVYTLVVFFMGISIIGWTTIMLVLSVCFFCIFIILTIILKYLAIIVSLIFSKQSYVFESIQKL